MNRILKRLAVMIAFSGVGLYGTAQNYRHFGGTYYDSIPLFLESNLLCAKPIGDTVILLSDHVQISISERNHFEMIGPFILIINTNGTDFPTIPAEGIEYRIGQKKWQPFPKGALILDTTITVNQSVVMELRHKRNLRFIERLVLRREQWPPSIKGFLARIPARSFDSKVISRNAYKAKRILPGFDSLTSNTMTVEPGKQLELEITNRFLNKDSCIEYRLISLDTHDKTDWQLTGHLLELYSIKANNDYSLKLRYQGSAKTKLYTIHALPYPWQKPIAIKFFIASGLLIITGFFYLRSRHRENRKERRRHLARERLKTAMNIFNPHFIYNVISSILGLLGDNQIDKAGVYLRMLAEIIQYTFRNRHKAVVDFTKELVILEKYMLMEQMRFHFRFEFIIDPNVSLEMVELPLMILQPSLENAIKHGVSGMGEEGLITVSVSAIKDDLIITVSDNGQHDENTKTKGSGQGVEITRERMADLQELFMEDRIAYELSITKEGAVARFYFENWLA